MKNEKIFVLLLCLMLLIGIAGCSGGGGGGTTSNSGTTTDPLVGTWNGIGFPYTTLVFKADHTGWFEGGQDFTWDLQGDKLTLILQGTGDHEEFLFNWKDSNKKGFTLVAHYGATEHSDWNRAI